MDTRFLQSFVTVAEHGSLAEAARRLNLTPAAVAQRIRALEAELGTALVVRSGRMVRPTEGGIAILDRARRFLGDIRDLKTAAAGSTVAGELRLGAVSTALTGLMPDILLTLTRLHPGVEIYIEPGTSMELYRKVTDGTLDAAILIQPNFPVPKTCEFSLIRREKLLLIAPGATPTRDVRALLTTLPFIRYDRQHWGGRLADAYLRQSGLRPAERFELDSLEAIAVMVDRGLGVSLVPDWAPPWPSGLLLLKLPLDEAPTRDIGVLWLTASPRLRAVRAFVAACGDAPA